MSMVTPQQEFANRLPEVIRKCIPEATRVGSLQQLLGGAIQEIWSFDASTESGTIPLVLRRANVWSDPGDEATSGLSTEGKVVQAVSKTSVPVPQVYYILNEEDGLGTGFIMQRVPGVAIARKILRDACFAQVRPKLARRCGEILASIHRVPLADLPPLRQAPAPIELAHYLSQFRSYGAPHPTFELAFKWLEDHLPQPQELKLVHGDFRNGNLLIGESDVNAVLDWELAHLGDPMEDLGWFCVNSWRFGNIEQHAGGFGSREELFAGYEAVSGQRVDPDRVRYWEVLGTLKWGLMCEGMGLAFQQGIDRSVERGAIGRRVSETEIDILQLLSTHAGP